MTVFILTARTRKFFEAFQLLLLLSCGHVDVLLRRDSPSLIEQPLVQNLRDQILILFYLKNLYPFKQYKFSTAKQYLFKNLRMCAI
jgi:hypothetical protein